jgi:hypothetical protein
MRLFTTLAHAWAPDWATPTEEQLKPVHATIATDVLERGRPRSVAA